jgi:hypothetical protein
MEFDLKGLTQGIKRFCNNLGKVAVIIIAMACGYAASEIYHRYKAGTKANEMQEAKTFQETSAAVNERGELMIIDRKHGTYQIYDSQVGKTIFDLYAKEIYYKQKTGN